MQQAPQAPQFVAPQTLVPQQQGFDPAAARQQAVQTAQQHLAAPGTVQAPTNQPLPQHLRHAEYQAQPIDAHFVPGMHPMQRNS